MISASVNIANAPLPAEETPESVRADSLRMLAELARIGMAISRSLEELAALDLARGMQAQTAWTPPGTGPAQPPKSGNDVGLSLLRVSRAVRLTLAMRLRLVGEPVEAASPKPAAPRAPVDPEAAREARRRRWSTLAKDMVRQGVERAIAAEARGEKAESLYAELHEKLEAPDELAELDGLGLSQIIVKICNDLGVGPRDKLAARRQAAREAGVALQPEPPDPAERRLGPGSFSPPSRASGRDDGWGGARDDGPDEDVDLAANDNPDDQPP
jgi:hypothetical protein